MTSTWPADTLAAIERADDLRVSPLRADGVTFGTPTWIWSVVVDGELYVRPYNKTASRWYRAALAHPEGRIHAAGQVFDVWFEPAPSGLADRIDQAYRDRYSSSEYLAAMIGPRMRALGLRIVPVQPQDSTPGDRSPSSR